MLADGLTKPRMFPRLMHFATTGVLFLEWAAPKPMKMRGSKARELTEQDLVNLDE